MFSKIYDLEITPDIHRAAGALLVIAVNSKGTYLPQYEDYFDILTGFLYQFQLKVK